MMQDVIERERLEDILRFVGEGVIYHDADCKIRFINQSAQHILGISDDEAKCRTSMHPHRSLVYEDGSPCPEEEHPSTITLRTGQALSEQIRGIAKPGQPVVWLSINTRPVYRPGAESPEAVVVSFNDITKRKRAEEALRTSEERYRDVASVQAGIIWEMDDRFIVTHLSGHVREVVGYEPEEIIGRDAIFLLDSEDRNRIGTLMTRLPRERGGVKSFEYWCRHRDGRRVRILTSCVLCFAKDGSFSGFRGTHLDITESYWARRRKDIFIELHKMSRESDAAISAMLCKVCAEFTDSPLAFFGLLEPDESAMTAHVWSPQAMAECRVVDKPIRFPIDTAGLWADPVRRREPVIVNDYSVSQGKAGLPDGHVPITRYLGVPIVEGGKVIAVAGAANRPSEYGDRHIERLRLVLSLIADFLSIRRKETALRESAEMYRALVDGLPDTVMRFDRQGRHLFVSGNVGEVVDIEASQFIGKTHAELGFPEADCRFWEESIQRVFESGIPFETEFSFDGKAGAVFFNWRLIPEWDARGGVSSVLSISRDITARKNAEEELRRSLQTAADLVAAIPSGLFIYQYQPPDRLTLLSSNPEAERLTGISENEYRGREFNQIWPQAKEAGITDKYLEVMRTGQAYETEDLHYQDHRLSGAYRIRAFVLPGERLAVAFEDVTSIRKAEVRLLEQEKVLTDILEDTLSGYWDWNLVENTEYLSPAFKKMFGYEDHQLPNSPEVWQRLIFPDDLPGVLDVFDRHVKSHGREPYYNEVRYRHRDGSTVWVICAGRVIEWADDGSPVRMVGCHVDITERKKAEEELRLHSLVLEQIQDVVTVTDLGGRITYVNDACCKMLGRAREALIGQHVSILGQDPATGATQDEILRQTLSNGNWRGQVGNFTASGARIILDCRTRVVTNTQGESIALCGISTDITHRKLSEEALRASEEKFRALFASNPHGIALVDTKNQRFLQANNRLLDMLGYDEDELCQLTVRDITHPDDWEHESALIQRCLGSTDSTFNITKRYLRKDGQTIWVRVTGDVIKLSQSAPALAIANVEDVTEHLRAEKALRASEERFRQLYENAPIAYQSLDPEGLILDVNATWLRILGYEKNEVIGRWFGSFLQDDFLPHFENKFPCFKEAGHISGVEFMMRKKDGSSVHVSFNGNIAQDPQGRMIRSHCVFHDITEHRRIESQLRQAQKMEALGTLAGGIAHDFNNIMSAVLGFAEIAQADAVNGHTDPADIQQIISSALRAKDLVKQILTFGRKNDPTLQPLCLNQACRHAQRILERTIPRMVTIECDLADVLPHISADPNQMEQMLLNLCSNAADAMPDGGRLVLATQLLRPDEPFHLLHPEVPAGEYVLLSVSDTGFGMNRETMEHIFEPFFTTKEVGKGTGLGLSTVYGIVKSHGGFIYCDSEPDQGTTFRVYLPAMKQEQSLPQTEALAGKETAFGGNETILLVEDEDTLRRIAARMLRGAGYRVLEASSGEEALKAFAEQTAPPDLVITDLGMPGMGGHKAMLELFARYPGIKVIVVSGYAAQAQVKVSMDAGAKAYVAKPFKKADLLATVRSVLDGK